MSGRINIKTESIPVPSSSTSSPSPSSSIIKPPSRRGPSKPGSKTSISHTPNSGAGPSYARAYRSRKTRPCDLCRRRKSRCVIEIPNEPCLSCAMNNKECTFVGPTTKRKRTSSTQNGSSSNKVEINNPNSSSSTTISNKIPSTSGTQDQNFTSENSTRRASLNNPNHFETYPAGVVANAPVDNSKRRLSFAVDPPTWSRSGSDSTSNLPRQFNDLVATLVNGDRINEEFLDDASDSSNERAPVEERGLTPFVLGSSSDMREDPLLKQLTTTDEARSRISGQDYTFGSPNLSHNSSVGHPRPVQAFEVRQVTRDISKPPVFFAFIPANPYGRSSNSKGKELGTSSYESLRRLLRGKISPLMALYSQRDASAFPVLSNSQRQAFRLAATSKLEKTSPNSVSKPNPKSSSSSTPINNSNKESFEETEIPLPTVLSISTLATATVYDHSLRAINRQAWGYNLHALKVQFEITSLVTIQIALTDLTGRPSINSSGNALTLSQTYAMAHMLGLHLDCTTWHFPKEERDLRTRLFWGLLIHDKFSALCWGRPSIIHETDFNVPLPSRTALSPCQEHLDDSSLASFDFGTDASSYVQSLRNHAHAGCNQATGSTGEMAAPNCQSSVHQTHTPGDTFIGLCRLSLLLSDVLREFHSVRASSGPRRDSFSVVQSVKSYLVRLEDWKAVLPISLKLSFESEEQKIDIPGTSSLQLSYYGVLLLLCRTALDAVTSNETLDESRVMPAHQIALHVAHQVVDFVEKLTPSDYTGFWFHYGSHHLASCLSLLSRLILGFTHLDEPHLAASAVQGFETLFRLLVDARRTWLWDLAELSLTRCKAILPALEEKLPNFPKLLPLLGEVQVQRRPSQATAQLPTQIQNQAQVQPQPQPQSYPRYPGAENNHSRVYSSGDVPMRNAAGPSSSSSSSFHSSYESNQPLQPQYQQYQPNHSSQYDQQLQLQNHQRSQSMQESNQYQHHSQQFPNQGYTVMGQSQPQPGREAMYSNQPHSSSGLPQGLSLDAASLAAVGLGDWGPGGLTNYAGAMTDPTIPQTWNNQGGGSAVEGWMPVDLQWLVNAKGNEGGT